MYIILIIVTIILLTILYRWRFTQIGYGWLLQFNEEKRPEVVIVARLLKSPAYDAGIPNGAVLLGHNGIRLDFKSNYEFQAWVKDKPKPTKNVPLTCIIKDDNGEKTVTMLPRRVQKSIPTYGPIIDHVQPQFVAGHLVCYGIIQCGKTGQWRQTRSFREL